MGFLQGEYGGWYKPSTQEERPITGPVKERRLLGEGVGDGSTEQTGNGNGSNGESGDGLGSIILLIAAAMSLG